jgi:hypothetical protein
VNVLEEALERREAARVRYLRDFLKVGGKKTNFAAFGMSDVADYVPPEQRLAIGVAFGDEPKSLGLALRASKHGGVAHRAGLDLANAAEKDGSWADYKIVSDLSIPARTSVTSITHGNSFPLSGDPLTMGVSVSHPKSPAGSLGGFVKFQSGEDGIISACHVLANSGRGVDVSSPDAAPLIYHPASGDAAGRLTPGNRIARLQNFVEITTSSVEIDAAVAVLLPQRAHIGNVVPPVPGAEGIGKPISKPLP